MKHIFFNLILLLGILSISLLMGEGLLILKNRNMKNYDIEMWRYAKTIKKRSENPVLGHEHVPNKSAILQSVEIRTNNFGLRGPDIDRQSPKKRRILFLGSSATLGWGVPESETLTAFISEKLGDNIEVLNAGIGNYNTVRYVELFITKLAVLNPTDIVVQYFINDTEVLSAEGKNWFLQNSQFAVTLWQIIHRVFNKNSEATMLEYYRGLYKPDAVGYQAMLKSLDRLQAYTDSKGIRVYFLLTPDLYNPSDYKYSFIHRIVKKEALKRGFIYTDLLPAFEGVKDASSLWAMPNDPHPNGVAQKMMATYFLANSDLLSPASQN